MVKEIDIRKARQDPLVPRKQAPVIIPGSAHTSPVNPVETHTTVTSPTQRTQSFISRFFDIMVCDIMVLFRRPLSEKQEDIIRKAQDFEKFEEFCKLSRGEK
jgi:hypothetical protein